MKIEYYATFRVNLGNAIPEVGDLVNRVNEGLSSFGRDEKLYLTHEGIIPPMTITGDRELTKEEEEKMKSLLEESIREHFPQYDVRLASFGRKSVTSELSVS